MANLGNTLKAGLVLNGEKKTVGGEGLSLTVGFSTVRQLDHQVFKSPSETSVKMPILSDQFNRPDVEIVTKVMMQACLVYRSYASHIITSLTYRQDISHFEQFICASW